MSRRQNNSGNAVTTEPEGPDASRFDVYKSVSLIILDITIIQSLIGVLVYTLANRDKDGLDDTDTALVVMTVFTILIYLISFMISSFLLFVKYTCRHNRVFNANVFNIVNTVLTGVGLIFDVTVTFLTVQSISNR